jgi:hypothetical protein
MNNAYRIADRNFEGKMQVLMTYIVRRCGVDQIVVDVVQWRDVVNTLVRLRVL